MTVFGFHASHEQIDPAALLKAVVRAEEAGFDAAMCSDHFSPWSERQGQSGFAWSWLGAALQATRLPFGVVNAPGQRYHPAIIAQAIGTLGQMYPGRFWAALGSGEAINEHITGDPWPRKEERMERLRECVDVIRDLLAGEEVNHDGLVTVERAKIYTLPEIQPALIAPAVRAATYPSPRRGRTGPGPAADEDVAALRGEPRIAVEAGEALAERTVELEMRRFQQEIARRAGKALGDEWAFDVRSAGDDPHGGQGAHARQPAASEVQVRAGRRDLSLEAAGEVAGARDGEAELPERRLEPDAGVGDVEDDVGQGEGLVRGRRHHLADVAPDDTVVHHLALQPDPARNDSIDAHASGQAPAQLDHGVASDEVGVLRVADDEIADDLRPEADALELIGCSDATLLELLVQDFAGDRTARDPQPRDEQEGEKQEPQQTDREDPLPSALADDNRLTSPVFAPPLSHRALITPPIRSRSVRDPTEALRSVAVVA